MAKARSSRPNVASFNRHKQAGTSRPMTPASHGAAAYNRGVNSEKDSVREQIAALESSKRPDSPRRPLGRILGLDVGSRRIGIAVSDPLGITAQGLDTLQRRNKRADFEQLGRVIREYSVKEIVVGLPLRM